MKSVSPWLLIASTCSRRLKELKTILRLFGFTSWDCTENFHMLDKREKYTFIFGLTSWDCTENFHMLDKREKYTFIFAHLQIINTILNANTDNTQTLTMNHSLTFLSHCLLFTTASLNGIWVNNKTIINAFVPTIYLFTVPSAILEMQQRTRENEAGVDSC